METPSSARRVTRSQALASFNNNISCSKGNKEECEKSASKTRTTNGKHQQERSALIDITNDSPIVGLAMETPSSAVGKQRSSRAKSMMMTPGSGEALLRGQVKTLLQKVEEEAELSKASVESRTFLGLQGCVNPMGLMAPTPANTPQLTNLCEDGIGGPIVIALPVVEEQLRTCGVSGGFIFDGMKQEVMSIESQKSVITRSLLLDFAEQSSESSSVVNKEKASSTDDGDEYTSIWSIQVNNNGNIDDDDEDDYEEAIEETVNDYYEQGDDGDDDDDGVVDELCEGLSKINMKEMFRGRHTKFVYNSDDEIAPTFSY